MFLPDHLVAAMGAHVVERVDAVVEVAGDHDRCQFAGKSRVKYEPFAEPLDPPDAQPVSLEQASARRRRTPGNRILVVDRRCPQLGVVGGVLPATGGQALLNGGHD